MAQINAVRLSEAIAGLYEAAYDQLEWPSAIEKLRQLFDGSKACFVRQGPVLQPTDAVATESDPAFLFTYIENFSQNVLASAVDRVKVGTIYEDHAIVGPDVLRKSQFWNEWMAPQDMYGGLACKLLSSGSSYWVFDVQRGRHQPEFDDQDKKLLAQLAPHLLRAGQITRDFQATRALADVVSYLPFGVILVHADLRIAEMNAFAETMLAQPRGALSAKSGYLATSDGRNLAQLKSLVANACKIPAGTGGDMLIRPTDSGDARSVVVSISPALVGQSRGAFFAPSAIVSIRDLALELPPGFEKQAQTLFGLTPSEARLATSLAAGSSLKDAAADNNIRFSTARSYLDNIFRKTETKQQSQLVALLKSVQPLIGSR